MNAPARIELAPVGDLAARVAVLEELVAVLVAGSPRRVYMADVVRFQLPKVLPELMRRHPQGVTSGIVAKHFGYPLATTGAAISKLVRAGKIDRHRAPGGNLTVLVPHGVAPPRPKLTLARTRVLDTMKRLSTEGRLEIAEHHIAAPIGMSIANARYHISRLIADGYVKLTWRGRNGRPTIYFIPSAIQ